MFSYQLRKDDLRLLLSSIIRSEVDKAEMSPSTYRQIADWATRAQLLNRQGQLTSEGELVAMKDPHLETTVTDWLIHFNLSENDDLWNYFVHDFLPQNSTFSCDELVSSRIQNLPSNLVNEEDEITSIPENYLESGALANIQLLKEEHQLLSIDQPNLSNQYTVGYLLAKIWDREFKKHSAIPVDRILDPEVKLSSVLGIDSSELREQIDLLAEAEIIEQRSAKPFAAGIKPPIRQADEFFYQVYRCWENPTELLEKAYENDIATPNRPLIQSLSNVLDDDDDVPDFSQFLEWASHLSILDCKPKNRIRLAS